MQTEATATEVTTTAAPVEAVSAPAQAVPASAAPAIEETKPDTPITAQEGDEDSTQQDQDRKDNGQFKSGAQKRIDALVFQRHQAEREAAYWKEQAQASKSAAAVPKYADFESEDEYQNAVQQYRIDEGVNRGLSKTAEQQAERFSQQAQNVAAEAYNQRVKEAVARIPDFTDVVGKSEVPMTPALRDALMDSDRGPELVYHLAKNPAEAERLNSMSVRQMDREIGRLESSFATKPAPPAARTTSAPAPIKPGAPASAPATNDPAKMDQTQFEAWAKANGSRYIR